MTTTTMRLWIKRWLEILRPHRGGRHVRAAQPVYVLDTTWPGRVPPTIGYFTPASGIAGLHKRRDAVARLRDISLVRLQEIASRSLGPVDPRIVGRIGHRPAFNRSGPYRPSLPGMIQRDQTILLDMYRRVRDEVR